MSLLLNIKYELNRKEISASSEEIAAASQSLEELTLRMARDVNRFKLA